MSLAGLLKMYYLHLMNYQWRNCYFLPTAVNICGMVWNVRQEATGTELRCKTYSWIVLYEAHDTRGTKRSDSYWTLLSCIEIDQKHVYEKTHKYQCWMCSLCRQCTITENDPAVQVAQNGTLVEVLVHMRWIRDVPNIYFIHEASQLLTRVQHIVYSAKLHTKLTSSNLAWKPYAYMWQHQEAQLPEITSLFYYIEEGELAG